MTQWWERMLVSYHCGLGPVPGPRWPLRFLFGSRPYISSRVYFWGLQFFVLRTVTNTTNIQFDLVGVPDLEAFEGML